MRRTTRLPQLGFAVFSLLVGARLAVAQPAATLAHATCVGSMGGTTYVSAGFSAPFEKDARGEQNYHTMVTFGAAFSAYIEQKYGGAKGSAASTCALVASLEQAQGGVKGRTQAAKRMGRPVVETDWVYKPAKPSTPQSAQPATSATQTPSPNASPQ